MMADPGDHDGPISAITMAGIRIVTRPGIQILGRRTRVDALTEAFAELEEVVVKPRRQLRLRDRTSVWHDEGTM
jgi:hypothetical protein